MEYIVVNKTAIQKRIEELENKLKCEPNPFLNTSYRTELDTLKRILSQSTPLIPELEKAFDASWFKAHGVMANKEKEKQDYILNLKLDA